MTIINFQIQRKNIIFAMFFLHFINWENIIKKVILHED